ncbi:ABC transporter ATP-binding protein [Methanospirillum sp.]
MTLQVCCGFFEYEVGNPIIHNVSFSVNPGEVMAILGPNGSGKTTLLKCVSGIHKWHKGSLVLDGKELDINHISSTIAYVPQSHSVTFPYTVFEMVLFGRAPTLSFFSLPSGKDKERVFEILTELKISHLAERSCSEISGGELQLVLIARALVSRPKVILLDEPESHLDFKNQIVILNLLRNLTDNDGLMCIFNTHFPDHALKIADKVLMIRRNHHIFGSTDEVITRDNLLEYFGVKVGFVTYQNETGIPIQVMVPLGLVEES